MFRGGVFLIVTALCTCRAFAGIVLDGSFGTSGALPGPNYMISASFGKQVGTNLFQSFSQFNLISTESATFTGPANIHNIVSRVTGGSPSSIDGKINSDIQGANLFFVNPSGVVFGQHAQINTTGSVVISTAHYLKMSDGGRFNASLGGTNTLTSAPISAFGFLNPNPAPVSIANATLTSAPGKSFSVFAGDITLNGTQLSAPGGNIALFSARAAGEVAYDEAAPSINFRDSTLSDFGNITIQSGATVAIDSAIGGGKIAMRGGQVLITDSTTVSSTNQGSNVGGDIELTADSLTLTGSGTQLAANSASSGNGGSISVTAGSLLLSDSAEIGALSSGTGNAGTITLQTHNFELNNNASVSVSTSGPGAGGDIFVKTGTADIDGPISSETTGSGNAGNILIQGSALSITSSAVISSSTSAGGKGGDVTVNGGSILLDGGFILASAFLGSTGDAGKVTVSGNSIVIRNEGFVDSSTDPSTTGNAGAVTLMADSILLDTGATVFSDSLGTGNGGEVTMNAKSLVIQGMFTQFTPTGVDTSADGGGNAGDVRLTADSLVVRGGAFVASSSSDAGNAGNIFLKGSAVRINHADIGTTAFGTSTGNGGNITIQAQNLNIVNGRDLGIRANAFTNGGSIDFRVSGLVNVNDTSITAAAGNAGGNITISHPTFIILSNSPVSANASVGQGGNINLVSDFFLAQNSPVTATGAIANGTVNITAPPLDLGAELITLPSSLVDAQNQLRERCTSLLEGDYSSFISIGRGGTEPEPDELEDASDDGP